LDKYNRGLTRENIDNFDAGYQASDWGRFVGPGTTNRVGPLRGLFAVKVLAALLAALALELLKGLFFLVF
jgi:hypothetical protein